MDDHPLTLPEAFCRLSAAQKPEDLFGPPQAPEELLAHVRQLAHAFILLLHPDRNGGRYAAEIHKVVALRTEAEKLIADGTYGQPRLPPVEALLRSKGTEYRVTAKLGHDHVADFYLAEATGGIEGPAVCKLVRSPRDNDLMEQEAKVLGILRRQDDEKSKTFHKYTPKLFESFLVHEAGGVRRRCNTFKRSKGWYSLADVKAAYPDGLDPRDVAWMLNRCLEGLGWVHSSGYVHGAVVPPNILVRPADHGGRLVGWTSVVRAGERLVAIPKAFKHCYEDLEKKPATPKIDLALVGESFHGLLNGLTEVAAPEFYDFIMYLESAKDGWAAYRQLDKILTKLYGPKTFRPFSMPARVSVS